MVKADVLQVIMGPLVGVSPLEITFSGGIITDFPIVVPILCRGRPNRVLQDMDRLIGILVVPLLKQVQIGPPCRIITCDEVAEIFKQMDEIREIQGRKDSDHVQMVSTYRVQENGQDW
jgi:hypothetical protein